MPNWEKAVRHRRSNVPMTLRWWEWLTGVTFALLGLLLLLSGAIAGGVTLLAFALVGAASRAQIVEREVAGGHARPRALLGLVATATLFIVYLTVIAFFVIAANEHWSHDARGQVAIYALIGLEVLLFVEMRRRGDDALNWLSGSEAERIVGRELEPLRAEGWQIVHNLKKDRGGNIDHLVWSNRGAYAIETKSGRLHRSHLGQAKANAAWAKNKFGARWVEPVICLGREPPPEPQLDHGIWIVSPEQLRPWLQTRPLTAAGIPAAH
jgi:hypothetical protein